MDVDVQWAVELFSQQAYQSATGEARVADFGTHRS